MGYFIKKKRRVGGGVSGVIPDFLALFSFSWSVRPRSLLKKEQTFPIVHIKYEVMPSSLKHFNQTFPSMRVNDLNGFSLS